MNIPPEIQHYALLETITASGAVASVENSEAIWQVSLATPIAGSLTGRDRTDILRLDDHVEAVTKFFDLMRNGAVTGVVDTAELRLWQKTPLDFTCALTEAVHDSIDEIDDEDQRMDDFDNMPLTALREAMVEACPEFGGEPLPSPAD